MDFSRKNDHITLACESISRSKLSSGFDNYRFEHNALPEIDFNEIDTSVNFLDRKLNIPLIISSITNGTKLSEKINKNLAGIANDFGLGLAIGSQRIDFEKKSPPEAFRIRNYAKNILLFANLGAVQLNYGYSVDQCKKAVELIEADALVLHLNPIQEVFQIEGNTDFSGLLRKIEKVCSSMNYPVIVKEVGYGISLSVAKKLQNAGVYGIGIDGAGTISWTNLESNRSNDIVVKNSAQAFQNWGNPTADSLQEITKNLTNIKVIASGGVRSGVDIAKSIALGANLCGNATDFLEKIMISRADCENFVESLILELKTAMFCTGCKNINELKAVKLMKVK
ncbi:MAG: type 2 isopentenyl-diphosphate Delta-isomerase [Holosporaceae bacterium]|nr:type 2 isopentenyl-diphosphate Delta-isomerase [Holosporaceae bacterium]